MDDWDLLLAFLNAPEAIGDQRDSAGKNNLAPEPFSTQLQQQYGQQLRKDVHLAQDFYRALCNNIWQAADNADQRLAYTWRAAGELIAEVRTASGCPAEDYMDYYCLGSEGQVSPEVEQLLNNLGYKRQE